MLSWPAGARPQEDEQDKLYACLRQVVSRGWDYGGSLFALAASMVTDLIHHDPLCYRTLDAAGLPEAFLTAVQVSCSTSICCPTKPNVPSVRCSGAVEACSNRSLEGSQL